MAVTAKFLKYNGVSWEELTFPPSEHTHEEYANKSDIQTLTNGEGIMIDEDGAINLSGEYNGDFEIKELKINGASGGMINDISGTIIGFNDEGMPTIVNNEGRYFGIATDGLDGNYNYYEFPDKEGTVALLSDLPSSDELHTHNNRELLESITTPDVNNWNLAATQSSALITGSETAHRALLDAEYNEISKTYAKINDVYTKNDIDNRGFATQSQLSGKANSADVYTKTEVDGMIANAGGVSDDYLPLSGGEISGDVTIGSGVTLSKDGWVWFNEVYAGENDEVMMDSTGIQTSGQISCTDLYVNGTIYGGIPKYYIHTISITQAGGNNCNMAFTVISKSSTAFTVSSLYSNYPSKPFACSGYYNSLVTSKLAFTSSTQARIVYGPDQSTANVAVTGLTDTVIEII